MRTIIEMAREAGIRDCTCDSTKGCLGRFAAFVRADEREACAGLAERRMLTDENKNRKTGYDHACKVIAAAIRARGNTCTPPQTIEDEHIAKVTSDINSAVYKALAQPEQEPVGSVVRWVDGSLIHGWFGDPPPEGTLLYITPPRTWVGLTDEECMDAFDPFLGNHERARAIEAKLKEKNT